MIKNIQLPGLKTIASLAAYLLFAGAYYQLPLFSFNQNTYFLSGLAHAGYGYLSADRLAGQTDHILVFSTIVSLVHTHGSHWVFYVMLCGLAMVYAASLQAIAARTSEATSRIHETAIFFALFTLIHCAWVLNLFANLLPGLWRVAPRFQLLATLSTEGMAGQYILGPYLQPSAFGVLLITSLAFFVYGREYIAILCAVAAATVHPTYILHAGILTAAFMTVLLSEKRTLIAAKVGILAVVVIAPILLYVAILFHSSSPVLLTEAQTILVDVRIPHHAQLSVWFSKHSCIQLAIVLLGIGLSYRRGRLFYVLVLCTTASIGLTILQVVFDSPGLALLFPWRLSTWMVPTCATITIGAVAASIAKAIDRCSPPRLVQSVGVCFFWLSFAFLAETCFLGAKRTISAALAEPHDDVVSYAKANACLGQTYLVPLEYEGFRLASGLPIFVDWKSHPYREAEVCEWYDHLQYAKAFYQAERSDDAAAALASIQRIARITHVIVETEKEHLLNTNQVQPIFRGGRHVLLRLTRDERVERRAF